ncbi:putative permease [Geoglobus ahangari]|uniref:Putative permease n=1 Tax=Geoglobus ahangari TaxID=113653 RepID=A0A0F7IGG1_9EURY|nr:AI-2E family transporter [Geoglobus ahangari]AKG91718.1 putative permease [Geoglobus ahangari]
MERSKLLLFAVVITLIFTFLYLLSPLLDGIILGIVLAYVARPIHSRLKTRIGDAPSAFLSTMIIAIPLFFFLFYGIFQGITQLIFLLRNYQGYMSQIHTFISSLDPETASIVRSILTQFTDFVNTSIGDMAINVTTKFVFFIMNFFISSIVCFYAILDGKRVADRIIDAVFSSRDARGFFDELDRTFTGLWFGNFVAALLIGMASIPYFLYFEIPYAPLLSGLMFLAALIPVFAEWMVILPVAVYLFFIDGIKAAWFLAIGAFFLYIIPELILRPYFVGYTSKVHPLVLMLSFIGGGLVAGVSGFFLTPMLAAVLTALYNYYAGERKETEDGA